MKETEKLIGGICDGLEVEKTDSPVVYGVREGDGRIRVYQRMSDGRLHFAGIVWKFEAKKTTSAATTQEACFLAEM